MTTKNFLITYYRTLNEFSGPWVCKDLYNEKYMSKKWKKNARQKNVKTRDVKMLNSFHYH